MGSLAQSRQRSLLSCICAVAGMLALVPFEAYTDNLDQIIESKDYRAIERRHSRTDLLSAKELPPGSNFRKLFVMEEGGPARLLEWAGDSALNLVLGPVEPQFRGEYARVVRTYTTPEQHMIELRILVPHPYLRDAAETRVIKEFNDIYPAQNQIGYSQRLILDDGSEATLYELVDSSCSIIIPIKRSGVIYLHTKHAELKPTLIKAARALDLKRLNEKLLS